MLVKMWEKFDEATMGIVVRDIKRFIFVVTLTLKTSLIL